jgi:hypothetical protein
MCRILGDIVSQIPAVKTAKYRIKKTSGTIRFCKLDLETKQGYGKIFPR